MNAPTPGDLYCHYKTGDQYMVLHVGQMEADQTPVVIYKSYMVWDGPVWVRPLPEWNETVDYPDGTKGPRFKLRA